jgi:Protein of unknown function (DUF732)
MPSPRRLAMLTVPVMAGAALVSSAAIANADPTDDAYLAQLHAFGFTFTPDRNQAVLSMAHLICDNHSYGLTPDAIASSVDQFLGSQGISVGDVPSMVGLAELTYCPI